MQEKFTRTIALIGQDNFQKLQKSTVIVYGIGGVGSYVVEGLVRGGIGHIILVDKDVVSITNINRQIHATTETIGQEKIKVMKDRILKINPEINVEIYDAKKISNGEESLINNNIDYIVDAVDTVKTKIKLIEKAKKEDVKIISCMGTGNKLDPTKLEITDISKTSVCPLARAIRKELNKLNLKKVKVLYSKEQPIKTTLKDDETQKIVPASISFVPSVAGLIIAGEVIKDLIKYKVERK